MKKKMNLSNWKLKTMAVLLIGTYLLAPMDSSAEEASQVDSSQETVEELIDETNNIDSTTINKPGWHREESAWYYYNEDSEMQTGWIEVGNRKYFMDEDGVMQTGWHQEDDTWYYLMGSGAMRIGWGKVDNTWFYMDENGERQTGWITVGDTKYNLNDLGEMQTGWHQENGIWYYLSGSGAMQTDWTKVGNTWYYMDENGEMQTGWQKVKDTWYYMRNSGAMQTGWEKVRNTWYYMSESGAMQSGWTKVGDTWYYMRNSGAMQTGWQKVRNNWYYMRESGAMQTGWERVRNTWYYMNNSGAMQTGWQNIRNDRYYMNNSGAMQTGMIEVGDMQYFMNNSGVMQTGWKHIEDLWHYMDHTGAMQVVSEERKPVVYIDPGHGGTDSGASRGGVTEKQLNLEVSNYLIEELETMGYLVVTSRAFDTTIGLPARGNAANGANADLFISLHHNTANGRARGIETFIFNTRVGQETNRNNFRLSDPRVRESLRLADAVQSNLIQDTGLVNRGVKGQNFSVLRRTEMPAILVELGFMDNPTELAHIRTSAYQQKAAKAIANGVDSYFKAP